MLRIIDCPDTVVDMPLTRGRLASLIGNRQADTLLGDAAEVHVTFEWYKRYILRY
jgi:hypothetical protein